MRSPMLNESKPLITLYALAIRNELIVHPLRILPTSRIENRQHRPHNQQDIPSEARMLHVIHIQLQADGQHLLQFLLVIICCIQPEAHLLVQRICSNPSWIAGQMQLHATIAFRFFKNVFHQLSSQLQEEPPPNLPRHAQEVNGSLLSLLIFGWGGFYCSYSCPNSVTKSEPLITSVFTPR